MFNLAENMSRSFWMPHKNVFVMGLILIISANTKKRPFKRQKWAVRAGTFQGTKDSKTTSQAPHVPSSRPFSISPKSQILKSLSLSPFPHRFTSLDNVRRPESTRKLNSRRKRAYSSRTHQFRRRRTSLPPTSLGVMPSPTPPWPLRIRCASFFTVYTLASFSWARQESLLDP